ncbi:MAG: hypothetical protein QM601_04390 [Pseudoxanthomonas sp.]
MFRTDALQVTLEILDLISRIDEITGASRNTLKVHSRDLIARRHLQQHGSGRGAWYGMK